ncbi:MAG: TonB-dependent receptor plug domain-containing protein [Bacteroidales bacterium]|nr:TonB-dependent receptor plug domain-containing protein [Bacteroidales bacterium]MBN2819031.1 TonB-dependent receptor plug domain-containing protein [Bacteroidales bacterium]
MIFKYHEIKIWIFFALFVTGISSLSAQEKEIFNLSLEELMNVQVVSSSKATEKATDIPASVVVITREEIKDLGYHNLTDILSSVTGLYLVEQYNWSGMKGFGVRGYFTEGSFTNMVIMVDGSPVLREGYNNQYIMPRANVPVEAIDRIEIIRGPMSVIYGENAFFGAINIITLEDKKTSTDNIVSMKFGSNSTRQLFIRTEHLSNDFHAAFNVSARHTEGLNIPYTKMTSNLIDTATNLTKLQLSGLNNNSTTAGQLGEKTVYSNFIGSYKGISYTINHSYTNKGFLWETPSHNPDGNKLEITGTNIFLQYSKSVTKSLELKAKADYADYNSISRYKLYNDDFFGYSHIYSSILNFNIDLIYILKDKLQIQGGTLFDAMTNAGDDVDIPSFKNVGNSSFRLKEGDAIRKFQTYTQLRYTPIENVNFIAGIRAFKFSDYTYQRLVNMGEPDFRSLEKTYSDNDIYITYRLAMLYKMNEDHIFKLLYGTAIASPNIRHNTTNLNSILNDPNVDLNRIPQIAPSSIITYEIQYTGLLSKKVMVNFSGFLNELDNLIETKGFSVADTNYAIISQNSGKLKTTGIEGALKLRPGKNLEFNVSASYQLTKNQNEGYEDIEVGYTPRILAYFSLTNHFHYKTTASLYGYYVDEMQAAWNDSPTGGYRNSIKTPSYFVLNASLRVNDIKNTGIYSALHAFNLFNNEIMYPTDSMNEWADLGISGMPRMIFISLGLKF